MTREQLKKQTIITLNREDITIEEMAENILQLVDVAINKELRLHGVVGQSEQFYCKKGACKEAEQCNHCWNIENPAEVIKR